jgi:2-hydroxy-3-oxopropionate reductase
VWRIEEHSVANQSKLIGFIGVGVMGGPMARRLIERGYALVAYDTNPVALKRIVKLGARAAKSAREVADRAQIVFASLPTPQIVRAVATGDNGVIRGRAVKIFVDLSTTGSVIEKEIAQALAARRIATVDAPISGGAAGAAKGTLAVMVAGAPQAVAGVRAMLDVFGKVFVVGKKPGQAQIMKLLNNLLSTTALAVSIEAFVAGAKAGLDADMMVAVLNAGSGRNSATVDKIPNAVLTRTFDFGFPISGACKDIGLAIDECQAMGLPMLVGSAARQLWQFAYAQGGAKRDMTALVTYIEPWAGVVVKGKAARGTTKLR